MPNLPTHFNFAMETLSALDDPSLAPYAGSFLLGCTTPDIRARTKWKRDHTHFAPLEVDRVGTGTEGLFHANPELYEAARRSGETRAFLAGYVSHLATDESWITQVYQPYFARSDVFDNRMEANIADRAVQMDMDQGARQELGGMDGVLESLERSDWGVEVGFIDTGTLRQWREWVSEFIARPFTWDRLHFMAQRMYRDNEEAQAVVEGFLVSVPTSLERVYRKVPKKTITDFRETAVSASVRLIKEHLNGA